MRYAPALPARMRSQLTLADGRAVPVVNHIPRFVPHDRYAGSFSFQWDAYRNTQLDSAQNVGLTKAELFEKASLTPGLVDGKILLDAGVGIGRHAEILAEWGAQLVGVDLSTSVDVAYENLKRCDNAMVIQADLGDLPFKPGSFDIISSIGVLHHTPDTKEYTRRLVPLLKEGGMLTMWLYSHRFARRKQWIPLTSALPHAAFHDWCEWIVRVAEGGAGESVRQIRDRPDAVPLTTIRPSSAPCSRCSTATRRSITASIRRRRWWDGSRNSALPTSGWAPRKPRCPAANQPEQTGRSPAGVNPLETNSLYP